LVDGPKGRHSALPAGFFRFFRFRQQPVQPVRVDVAGALDSPAHQLALLVLHPLIVLDQLVRPDQHARFYCHRAQAVIRQVELGSQALPVDGRARAVILYQHLVFREFEDGAEQAAVLHD